MKFLLPLKKGINKMENGMQIVFVVSCVLNILLRLLILLVIKTTSSRFRNPQNVLRKSVG